MNPIYKNLSLLDINFFYLQNDSPNDKTKTTPKPPYTNACKI